METPKDRESKQDSRKIFVGGLTPSTTEDELKQHFEKYGTIEQVEIVKKESSQRMFGFVTYDKMDTCDEVFLERPHKLGDNNLEVKRAVPKGNTLPAFTLKTKKLFIANLPKDITQDKIKSALLDGHDERYGTIETIQLIMEKDSEGKPTDVCKGYGFITCSSEDMADKLALLFCNFECEGRKIEVKKSEPKPREQGMGRGGGGMQGYWGGYQHYNPYAYGGYGPYGYGSGYGWGQGYGQNQGRGARFQPY